MMGNAFYNALNFNGSTFLLKSPVFSDAVLGS